MASKFLEAAGKQAVQFVIDNPNTTKVVAGTSVGLLAAPLLVPVALGLVGFGGAGPIAGSLAVGWQASIGNVVAGSTFSILQSAAMGGAAAGTLTGTAAVGGAAAGAAVGVALKK